MKIIIGGGTGLVGQILVPELLQSGHEIYVIGRDEEKIKRTFSSTVHGTTWDKLNTLNPNEFDAIINLAGENIADHRWSPKTKETLLTSRIKTTNQLVLWGIKADTKKPHLYNASAVGIYGLQKKLAQDHITFTETTPPSTLLKPVLQAYWLLSGKKLPKKGLMQGCLLLSCVLA